LGLRAGSLWKTGNVWCGAELMKMRIGQSKKETITMRSSKPFQNLLIAWRCYAVSDAPVRSACAWNLNVGDVTATTSIIGYEISGLYPSRYFRFY
jgi:hypothetical protein